MGGPSGPADVLSTVSGSRAPHTHARSVQNHDSGLENRHRLPGVRTRRFSRAVLSVIAFAKATSKLGFWNHSRSLRFDGEQQDLFDELTRQGVTICGLAGAWRMDEPAIPGGWANPVQAVPGRQLWWSGGPPRAGSRHTCGVGLRFFPSYLEGSALDWQPVNRSPAHHHRAHEQGRGCKGRLA